MVKKILFLSWLFFTIWSWIIFANNQNKTSLDIEFEEKPEILEKSFKLESEKLSCTDLNKKLINFFEENKEFLKPIYRPRWFLEKWLLLKSEELATNSIAWSNDNIPQNLNIERNLTESNFSKTNIQKENVDEPEILKINENIFAYLHSWRSLDYKQHQKIEIISWNQNIKEIHSEINIPENFYVSNLLLYKNKLLVLWTRTIEKNTSSWYYTESFSRTTIMIIDIKNTKKPKIETVYDLSWQYQDARLIWNKLYLVTFKRTDPFFVIDLSNDKPKILWELKIPWYSTYLHEYEKERNWKHLILWLWYDAEEKWNFSINKWIKLDLYEIDYSKKELWIKQLWSKVFWDKWSFSPTLENPRTFVYDKENKTVILPMILSNRFTEKECYDNNTKCYNIEKDSTKFFWSKILKVEKDWNIKEIWEIDWFQYFKDWLKEKVNKYYYDIDNNIFRYLQSLIYEGRSWYLWNKYFFISPLWYTDWKQHINF